MNKKMGVNFAKSRFNHKSPTKPILKQKNR